MLGGCPLNGWKAVPLVLRIPSLVGTEVQRMGETRGGGKFCAISKMTTTVADSGHSSGQQAYFMMAVFAILE